MAAKRALQDPHSLVARREGDLEAAIGRQVRSLRKKLDMRVTELASLAGLSSGMLSKIENGLTSPSLGTLKALSAALNVPVTALFQQFRGAPRGDLRGCRPRASRSSGAAPAAVTNTGCWAISRDKALAVEPYIITLNHESDTFPYFQHAGTEFIYMLDGAMGYRHGDRVYAMAPGDSLFLRRRRFRTAPETLDRLPCNFLSIIAYLHGAEG